MERRAFGAAGLFVVLVAAILLAACMVPTLVQRAYADTETVNVTGTEYYDVAREVLAIVNKERAALGLTQLTLDANLEKTAMQRAAELSVYYSHTRPNGGRCFTAWPAGNTAKAENIAIGYRTAVAVMEGWFYEERELYNKYLAGDTKITEHDYGHYINIINPNYKSIGIGVFSQGSTYCWEQAFSSAAASGSVGSTSVQATHGISIDYDVCGTTQGFNMNLSASSLKNLEVGKTFTMSYCIRNAGFSYSYCSLDPAGINWKSSNPSVCSVDSNGVVTACAAGTSTITASLASGRSITNTWTVTVPMSSTQITIPDQTYTGSAIEPIPVITYGGKTLVKDTDYTVSSCKNNTNTGTASITIVGKGYYSGSLTTPFVIKPAPLSVPVAAAGLVYDGTSKVGVRAATGYTVTGGSATAAGNYEAKATPDKNHVWSTTGDARVLTIPWSISSISLSGANVTLGQTSYTYDGCAKTPYVSVTCSGKSLTKNRDYAVEYLNNVNAGTATVRITGMGNYKDSKTASFTIAATPSSNGSSSGNGLSNANGSSGSGSSSTSSGAGSASSGSGSSSNVTPSTPSKPGQGESPASGSVTQDSNTSGSTQAGSTATSSPSTAGNGGAPSAKPGTSSSSAAGSDASQANGSSSASDANAKPASSCKPKSAKLSKLKAAKKGFTAKWGKVSSKVSGKRITGYQVRYSLKANMKKATVKTVKGYAKTSLKVSKLKAKKIYYVQIRTYVKINGTTYYSAWSKAQAVKTM